MNAITFKTQEDTPNYQRAVSPGTSCSMCAHFQMKWCVMYDFPANPAWTCDSWESKPVEIKIGANVPSIEDPFRIALATTKELDVSFTTFKDKSGQWRWVLMSSNAFEDRETELITTKALAADVARTDKTGEYGPLRWWHVGNPQWSRPNDWRSVVAGKGLDIGDCDFSAMEGPILIESGTFRSEAIGKAIALKANQLRASLGFSHPLDEPDRDGLFHHIKRFERSLTPANRASNTRTGLTVTKEKAMDPVKLHTFKETVGDEVAEQVIASAQLTTKEAREAGIREKALDGTGLDAMAAELSDITAQIASFKAAVAGAQPTNTPAKPPVAPNATTPQAAPAAAVEEVVEEDGIEESGDEMGEPEEVYVGDMTGPEFAELLHSSLAPLFAEHTKALDLHGKLAQTRESMADMKSYLGNMGATAGTREKDDTIAVMREQIQLLQVSLKEAVEGLQELRGDVPKELATPRGPSYKASEGIDNLVHQGSPMYQEPLGETGQAQNPLSWIDSFVVAPSAQNPVQQAAVLQPGR